MQKYIRSQRKILKEKLLEKIEEESIREIPDTVDLEMFYNGSWSIPFFYECDCDLCRYAIENEKRMKEYKKNEPTVQKFSEIFFLKNFLYEKNNRVVVKSDHVKDGKRASREIFKGDPTGSRAHPDKTKYNRKQKHRKSYE